MRDNFQVETFDDKDQHDERYDELRKRVNADGTIGRRGLVKVSVGEWMTVQELVHRPGDGKLVLVDKDITVPVWAIAYPRRLPEPGYRKVSGRPFGPIDCTTSRRHRRARYWRRHPKKVFHATQSPLSP